uniref:GTPase domain-containing protein n=1 Tax=Eubacterium cellulosolvens TaxID=29322 RepID=UPI00048552F6|nr:GTPase domain-containing protein [[Eubacterium] cellulosolvens]
MNYTITCPYCFKKMKDDEVCFRSDKVNIGEYPDLPDGYDDAADFVDRCPPGDEKDRILRELSDWYFFAPTENDDYHDYDGINMSEAMGYFEYWKRFGTTTEAEFGNESVGIKPYMRRIIDPSVPAHKRFIKMQHPNGGVTAYIDDDDGMAAQIELTDGTICSNRVCKYCHNPLPEEFGKSPAKFITIIGTTGAGKTVYLTQLLNSITSYSAKVGLSAFINSSSVMDFISNNKVAAHTPLPNSTPSNTFQQPLVYQLKNSDKALAETVVLYDVAGELFSPQNKVLLKKFEPLLKQSDGFIILIKPSQFGAFLGDKDKPSTVIDSIHNSVSGRNKSDKPIAVCISQVDTQEVQTVLEQNEPALREQLIQDVIPLIDNQGFAKPQFNAADYNPIARNLYSFLMANDMELSKKLHDDYTWYNFFGFTSLGCEVELGENEDGEKYSYPAITPNPKRIEEPIFWLYYRFGFIDTNEKVYQPGDKEVRCPKCGGTDISEIPEEERIRKEKVGLFKSEQYYVDLRCNNPDCGYEWDSQAEMEDGA